MTDKSAMRYEEDQRIRRMGSQQAFVQYYGSKESTPEEFLNVLQVLRDRCVPVDIFTKKRLDRRQLAISADNTLLVVGDHDAMKIAFQMLGVPFEETEQSNDGSKKKSSHKKRILSREILPTDCYPPPLRKYMGRDVYETTQPNLLEEVKMKGGLRLFVKPKYDVKKFTGRVVETLHDVQLLPSATVFHACICMDFTAEFRIFVLEGRITGVQCYEGDASLKSKIDMITVRNAIDDLESSSYKTAAYALDFGLVYRSDQSRDTAKMDTLLVEWNDAYSLGSYGLPASQYTDMLTARWQEVAQYVRQTS